MLRRAVTSLRLRLADALEAGSGDRDPLIPPRRLRFVGNSDFRATGDEFRRHFREFGGLHSADRVLDIGCGSGRMARVLARELRPPGSYDGFDVSLRGVSWCAEHYRGTHVPFRFAHADLRHPEYNPGGAVEADTFSFPYEDRSFDLAIATSVFTHLLDGVADRYLAETARVLAPGGRLFATWFALDPARAPDPERAIVAFKPTAGAALVADPAAPELAVGYPAAWIRERLARHGLSLREPYRQGSWTGRPGPSAQDILVADRP